MSNNVIKFPVAVHPQTITVPKIPSQVRSLACALRINLRINSSSSLIYLLGTGTEQSNQSAIETWLLTEYGLDKIISMKDPLDQLTKDLKTHLNNQIIDKEEI